MALDGADAARPVERPCPGCRTKALAAEVEGTLDDALGKATSAAPPALHVLRRRRVHIQPARGDAARVAGRPRKNQCFWGTSPLAMAKKLASRASEASRS